MGIDPARVIFIQASKKADKQWAMEEALQCNALTAVVGEMEALDFKQSRRLQLNAEKSGVTAFVLPSNLRPRSNAASSRWLVRSLPSLTTDGLPGVGSPQWGVELRHMRHGKPGNWEIGWADGQFACKTGFSSITNNQDLAEMPAIRAMAVSSEEPFYFSDELPDTRALAGSAALQPFPAGDLLHGFYIHEKRVYA
jgi:hypothetical protein